MKNFVHLHVHTEYSLLDGAARIEELLDAVKNFGMSAVAMTDHGAMYGTIDFYKAAVKRGIKPIIGCEVYIAPDLPLPAQNGEKYCHLILIAENNIGYKNLIKLVSNAEVDTKQDKPHITKENLRGHCEGIIALSACLNGEIPRIILQHDTADDFGHLFSNITNSEDEIFSRALKIAEEYAEIFGRENFFIELQNHGLNDEKIVNEKLIEIARRLNLGIVAANDVHYVKKDDSSAQDILMCLQYNKTLSDETRPKFSNAEYYLKTAAEMYELFAEIPEACENTVKIAERCNVTFNFGELHLPEFKKIPEGETSNYYLRELCKEKIFERYENPDEKIFERLNSELDVIEKMDFADYFLIVQDFINFAKQNEIAVGPGRGSATGSLVSYALGITDIDPLKFNLLFERFLNPERVTMPDIDIDFCYIKRRQVIDYVKELYGNDNVAQIITFGTMAAKAAIRDVARVLSVPYAESSRLAEMIPNELKMTLDKALEISNDLKKSYSENLTTRKVIDIARKLEGMPRHASVHAAGIVISKLPLTEYLPVQNLNGVIVTQFDKDKIEELGLLKMDFLGLRTLTIIDDAVKNIAENFGIKIDVTKIPLDDKLTAEMLTEGDTGAVFQMESQGMTSLVKDLKPTCFEDLIPTIALFRPGPLGSGMVKDFVDGKHGLRKVTYLHPKLEPILRETYGVILYQEQVMQIVQALAGFTLGQADLLRRAMAKKKASILIAQKENFLKGCVSNGIEINLAEKIFGLLEHFADYGFNKSHSAAYAWLAWQTAYLKAHYPAEFMAATLSSVMDSDKISFYVEINGDKFFAKDNQIYFALSAVKNLGEPAVKSIIETRKNGKFTSLTDFCNRVIISYFNRHSLENLIKCGAFDEINPNRTALLNSLEKIIAVCRNKNSPNYPEKLNDALDNENNLSADADDKHEYFSWEKEVLGFYISSNPLKKFAEILSRMKTFEEIKLGALQHNASVKIGGLITDYRKIRTRRGYDMAFVTLENLQSNKLSVTIFSALFERCKNFLDEGKVIVVEGKTDYSEGGIKILADTVTPIEDYLPKIYLTVPAEIDTPQIVQELKKIFSDNNGNSEIYLQRRGKWSLIKNQGVDDEIVTRLKNLVGTSNIKIY